MPGKNATSITRIGGRFEVERSLVTWGGDPSTARVLVSLRETSIGEDAPMYAAVLEDHEARTLGHALLLHSAPGVEPDDPSVLPSRTGPKMPDRQEAVHAHITTPEQWIDAWNEAAADTNAERRLKMAASVIHNAEQASRCFLLDHDAQAEEIARLRADNVRMRVLLTRILDTPRRPAPSEQDGAFGRAYTRGWQSAIDAIDTALFAGENP